MTSRPESVVLGVVPEDADEDYEPEGYVRRVDPRLVVDENLCHSPSELARTAPDA